MLKPTMGILPPTMIMSGRDASGPEEHELMPAYRFPGTASPANQHAAWPSDK
jgi:hypothetical protein